MFCNRADVKIPASQNSGHDPNPGCVVWVLEFRFRDRIQNPWKRVASEVREDPERATYSSTTPYGSSIWFLSPQEKNTLAPPSEVANPRHRRRLAMLQ